MRTHGICPLCGHDGLLPGRTNRADPQPICRSCADIPEDYRCRTCRIKELLTGDAESLHYGVAGMLLLLYAQPLVKVAALPTTAIVVTAGEIRISLGAEPVPVPEPFASMLKDHLHNRPNLRTAGGIAANPWLFPSRHPGKHMHTRSIVNRLGEVGINVLGARNSALRNLVAETPPPVVAKLLGFSDTCTQRHAPLAAQPWSRYVTR